jgi:hypothetical protein
MRDLAAPDVQDWLAQLERWGASPSRIRRAKAAPLAHGKSLEQVQGGSDTPSSRRP